MVHSTHTEAERGCRNVQVMEELKQYFRPEFLNRLDEIIVFRQLTKGEVKEIADIMLKDVLKRAKEREITIDLTEQCAPCRACFALSAVLLAGHCSPLRALQMRPKGAGRF